MTVRPHNKVCWYGRVGGKNCGYVLYTNLDFTAPWPPDLEKDVTVGKMTWVEVPEKDLTKPGDSGGPVYRGGTAVGIISGTKAYDTDHNGTEDWFFNVFTPISRIGKINLKVNTS